VKLVMIFGETDLLLWFDDERYNMMIIGERTQTNLHVDNLWNEILLYCFCLVDGHYDYFNWKLMFVVSVGQNDWILWATQTKIN